MLSPVPAVAKVFLFRLATELADPDFWGLPRLPSRFLQLALEVPGRGLGDLPQAVGAEPLADPFPRRGSSGALFYGAEEDPLVEGVAAVRA